MTTQPLAYTRAQIVLHWAIAALVLWQLFLGGEPPEEHAGRAAGDLWTRTIESSHVWIGLLILALVVVRITLRMVHGAPPQEEGSRLQAMAARASHLGFYALLVLMPVTGILAWYWGLPTADLHQAGEPLFIVLIVLHVAAVLWHQFVRRDRLMRRMMLSAR